MVAAFLVSLIIGWFFMCWVIRGWWKEYTERPARFGASLLASCIAGVVVGITVYFITDFIGAPIGSRITSIEFSAVFTVLAFCSSSLLIAIFIFARNR
jgi:hypothetical protein